MREDIKQDLSEKQLNFIDAYISEQDINKVCQKLDITRPTYYKYLNDDAIKQEITKIRIASLEETTRYMQNNLQECSKMLMDIVKSPNTSPQIKINAINSIFNNCNRLTEQVDILSKLEDVERRLAEKEEANDE